MSSIAYSIYDDSVRSTCYTCPDSGSGAVNVRGRGDMMLECRKYTEFGNTTETLLSARETDIFRTNLIDIVPIGVDTARLSFGKKFKFKTQSRGAGGLSKYDCNVDYQIPELIRHDKLGYTELLYVHHKMCPKKLISTELQDMVFESGSYQDAYDPNNALSDALIMAARETVSEHVQYCDIIGVFGGSDEKANAYDGILAQAYWAYAGMAYFHSIQYMVDSSVLIDGMFLHAKYSGNVIDLALDSSQETDEDLEVYDTKEKLYTRLVGWLNDEVITASGRKYVDATFTGDNIIVTSRWAESTVNLQMFVDAEETVDNWATCESYTGVSYKTLQGTMPIDERPILVEYKKYTQANIIYELPNDIHAADMEIDSTLMRNGQTLALYMDKYLWKTYRNALKTAKQDATRYDLSDDYTIYTLDALSQHGGTGLWFLTASSATEALRNVAHLVDVERRDTDDIYIGFTSNSCREVEMLYDTLHGVMMKDFRLFASNLLCSPFIKTLKQPYEKTIKMIPCLNRKVRSSFIDPVEATMNCNINAGFVKEDEYKNGALYDLNGNIHVLEAGQQMPAGAKPVYEVKFKDTTSGIPVQLLDQVQYEYTVTTDEGSQSVLTGKDPIFQYASSAAGTTFNVKQRVVLPNGCESTFNASEHYDDDFPFECRGECDGIEVKIEGRVDRVVLGQRATAVTFQPAGSTTQVVTSAGNIDLTDGSDINTAVDQINAFLQSGGHGGTAAVDGADITITGSNITIDSFNGVATADIEEYRLTVVDNTEYDAADGATLEIFVSETGTAAPTTATFTELPEGEVVDDYSANGWTVTVNLETTLGCSFDNLTTDVTLPAGDENASFEIGN